MAELGGIPANNRNDCDIKAIIVTNAVPGTSPTLHAQAPAPPYTLRHQPHFTHSLLFNPPQPKGELSKLPPGRDWGTPEGGGNGIWLVCPQAHLFDSHGGD